MSSIISITDLLHKGLAKLSEEHDTAEAPKVGTLRGGNTGAIALGGKIIGKCHRAAYLRFKGINLEDIGIDRELMFAAGHANEDLWVDVLKASGWSGPILKEEEIPTSWKTSQDITVTGRPDIVLCENKDKPVLGLELKLVSSIWTARDVAFQMKPKLPHLLQTAHYSWQLGVPFRLLYTSRADFAVGSGWEQKTFSKELTDFQLSIIQANNKGGIKKILPFLIAYEVDFTDKGQLKYRQEGTDKWEYTIITKDGIRDFYEMVAAMDTTKDLGPDLSPVDAMGNKESWSPCDWCEACKIAKAVDYNWDTWYRTCEQKAKELSQKTDKLSDRKNGSTG